MKSNNIFRNAIPNSLSLNYSNSCKNLLNPLQYRKIKSPSFNIPRNKIYENASIDTNLIHRPKLVSNRKIAKSSYMKQRINNYSYLMNNVYKDLYNDFNFPKIPSFNQNISEIHQIINGKKQKEIHYLDNLFFNSMFPNEYLNDLYAIRKKNIIYQHDKKATKILHRYNSSGQLKPLSKKYLIKLTKHDDSRDNDSSANSSNILKVKNKNNINYNPIKNIKSNNLSIISTTTNKSLNTNKFPEIYSNSNVSINEDNENKNNLHSPTFSLPKITQGQCNNISSLNSKSDEDIFDNYFNNNSFITNLGVGKMRHKLNELMFENGKQNKQISTFEKKILKFKIIQIYQKESLEKVLQDNRFNIQDRIDHIIKMYKMYENTYDEYITELNRYINYIILMISNNEMELENDIKKRRELEYEVEIIIDKLITKQKNLEYLINMRNFLFHVKNKDKKIIKLDNEYVLQVSNRKQLIDNLFNIFGYEPNTMIIKYLKRLLEIEELESILKNKNNRPNTRKSTNKIIKYNVEEDEIDALSPPPPGEIIFDDVDKFVKIIDDLEDRNITLLKEKEYIRLSIIKFKKEYDEYIAIENENFDSEKMDQMIKESIKRLKDIKEKNEKLKKKKEIFAKLYKVKDSDDISQENLKVVTHNLINNFRYFQFVYYSKLIQNYKYPFLLFLERLIHIVNSTLSSSDFQIVFKIEDCYKYIPLETLKEILSIKKEFFNDKNHDLIMVYCLKLIKLYEYIGEYLMRKNQFYKLNNEEIYKKHHELVQNERKIINAKVIRNLMQEKREEKAQKLIEKWEKKTVKKSRITDLESKPFFLMKSFSQKNIKEKAKNKMTTNEFNFKCINEF